MQEASETLSKLANMSISSDSDEEIEVIYVENLSGAEIVEFARYGEIQILEELVKMGMITKLTDAKDSRGNTALHMASANGHVETVKFILSTCNGNLDYINQVNGAQNTALHWSCLNGHVEVTRLLLDHGADHKLKNSSDRLPFDEAVQQHHDSIITLLADKASEGASDAGQLEESQ